MAGLAATYIDADSFSVVGDLTASFIVGRRVKADCGVDGFKYGTVVSSAYTTVTTVNLTAASDDLTANLTEAWFGIVGADDNAQSMPDHSHDGSESSGGPVSELFNVNTLIVSAKDGGLQFLDGSEIGEVFQDGSNLWVKNLEDSGSIVLYGNNSVGTPGTMAQLNRDSGIILFHAGNSVLATSSSGVNLDGLQINSSLEADDILDEDDMASDSATALITQQSARAMILDKYQGVNLLDNAAFQIGQQMWNTSPQGSDGDGYNQAGVDRWFFEQSGASRYTFNQDTVQPDLGDTGYNGIIPEDVGVYAANLQTETATGTVNAGDFGIGGQKIAASKLLPLILSASTFSFWCRPGATGTYCVVLRNGGWTSGGAPGSGTYDYVMQEFVVTTANEWQFIEVNFPALDVQTNPQNWGPAATTGIGGQTTLSNGGDAANLLGAELFITMFAGSTYNGGTADGSWYTGAHLASSSQTNNSVSTGNFRINQPKLEIGDVATQFLMPDHDHEKAKALRYYERVRVQAVSTPYCYGETLTATTSRFFLPFSSKRAIPVIGKITVSAASFSVRVAGANYAVSSFDSYTWSRQGVEIVVTHATVGASINFVASLIDNSAGTTHIDVDAGL